MSTRYRGPEPEARALTAFVKLVRAGNAITSELMGPLQREFGLTESQFGVLEALLHLGPLAQGQICQKILKSGSNVTTVVDNLERDGLVLRVRDEADRRVQVVHLTERGRELIERAFPAHAARITGLMEALTSAEQQELGRLCARLGKSVPASR